MLLNTLDLKSQNDRTRKQRKKVSNINYTLKPANGYVRQYSGVNLDSFLKAITYQKITANGLVDLGPVIELMASAEGLQAHKNAVSIRLKTLKS